MRNGPKDRIAGSTVNIKYIEYFAAVDGYHDFLDLEKCIKTNKWLSVRIVGSGSIAFVLIFLLIFFFFLIFNGVKDLLMNVEYYSIISKLLIHSIFLQKGT